MLINSRTVAWQTGLAAVLAGSAVVLGGGGSPAPLSELALQCLTAVLVMLWIVTAQANTPLVRVHRDVWIIAGMVLILPILQLIPLPPAVWQSFKGRELQQAALALVDAQDTWRPLSLLPTRTFASLLAMVPAVVMLIMVASLKRGGRAAVVGVVSVMAALSLVIGAGQIAAGEGNAFRFYDQDIGFLNGFQANHNSTADVLMVAMLGVAATIREMSAYSQRWRPTPAYRLSLTFGACVLFCFGVFLTASRMGMMLLPVALLGVLWMVWPLLKFNRGTLVIIGWLALLLVVAAGYLAATNPVVVKVLSRFDFAGEYRPQIWRETLHAIGVYFPWGSGMGTFVPVYAAGELLETVGPTYANRAHNDLLELLLEGGVIGAMLLTGVVWTVLASARQAITKPPAGSPGQVVFAITVLGVIALHSQVDYPLRSMSLALVAAMCVGLLIPVVDTGRRRG